MFEEEVVEESQCGSAKRRKGGEEEARREDEENPWRLVPEPLWGESEENEHEDEEGRRWLRLRHYHHPMNLWEPGRQKLEIVSDSKVAVAWLMKGGHGDDYVPEALRAISAANEALLKLAGAGWTTRLPSTDPIRWCPRQATKAPDRLTALAIERRQELWWIHPEAVNLIRAGGPFHGATDAGHRPDEAVASWAGCLWAWKDRSWTPVLMFGRWKSLAACRQTAEGGIINLFELAALKTLIAYCVDLEEGRLPRREVPLLLAFGEVLKISKLHQSWLGPVSTEPSWS